MLTRLIELTDTQYRIQQQIGQGASGIIFLAKRRPPKKKELLIHIDTTKSDLTYNPPRHNYQAQTHKQTIKHLQNNHGQLSKAEVLKQQRPLEQAISKTDIKKTDQPTRLDEDNKTKSNEVWQGQPCAIKMICLQQNNQMQSLQKDYWTELQMLQQLKFPGIISLIDHGIIQDSKKKELFLALEWGIGGNFSRLIDLVHERQHFLNQKDEIFKFYSAQLVEIISYLQSRGVSHRDIKAQNLILDKYYRLRLIDFGVAQIFDYDKANFQLNFPSQPQEIQLTHEDKVYIGSVHHLSPEMIERPRQNKDLLMYSKADIWGLGIVMYYMFTKTYPFNGSNRFHIIKSIKNKQVDCQKITDPLLVALLKSILNKNPGQRPDINEIKAHQYFRGTNFAKIFDGQSPILKITRCYSQQYFYKGETTVRISGITQYRVIGIFRRSSLMNSIKQQANNRKGSTVEPRFFKNQSEVTQTNSEKVIGSQAFLQAVQGQMTFKYFLSIAKKEAKSIPKNLEVDKNTKLSVSKLTCLLRGVKFNVEPEVQEPDSVQLGFASEEQLDKFVTRFGDMLRSK